MNSLNLKIGRKEAGYLLTVFLLYYSLATFSFIQLAEKDDLFFLKPKVDELTNLERSDSLLKGKITEDLFWQEPGTYVYLSLIRSAGFRNVEAIKAFQLFFINPIIIVLVFRLGHSVLKRYAVAGALLYALSPLTIFFALTLMKTTVSILLYTVWLLLLIHFAEKRSSLLRAICFSLSWFAAFSVRQNIVVLLLPAFLYLWFRGKNRTGKERLNVLLSALMIIVTAGGGILTSSILHGHPVATLTNNGKINFYLGNSRTAVNDMNIWPGPIWIKTNVELGAGRLDSMEYIREDFAGWAGLILKKTAWEFTPYNYFRMYDWDYFTDIVPWFSLSFFINLLIMSFAASLILFRKRLDSQWFLLFGIWGLYHLVNILFLPGIARYNTVILPVSIFLALKSSRLFAERIDYRLIFPCLFIVLLCFNTVPNDFKSEYVDYLRMYSSVIKGNSENIEIPERTGHREDWLIVKAGSLLNKGKYEDARRTVMKVNDFYKCGIYPCEVAEKASYHMGLYYDALRINQLIDLPVFAERRKELIYKTVNDAGTMLDMYRKRGLLSTYKSYLIAKFYYGLIGNRESGEREIELLKLSEKLLLEAIGIERNPADREKYRALHKAIKGKLSSFS